MAISVDTFFATLQLANDVYAAGKDVLVGDFNSLVTAVRSGSGTVDAFEKFAADAEGIVSSATIRADLLRLAVDVGLDVPADSSLRK